MKRILALAVAASLTAMAAQAETVKLHANMSPQSEVPPKDTAGTGSFDGTLNTADKELDYTLTYSKLTGPATMAHLHGPAESGANAGVMVPLGPKVESPITGKVTLTDAQIADIMAGKVYANVHTEANKGGELRGQVMKAN